MERNGSLGLLSLHWQNYTVAREDLLLSLPKTTQLGWRKYAGWTNKVLTVEMKES
jgi:hypothetical protein